MGGCAVVGERLLVLMSGRHCVIDDLMSGLDGAVVADETKFVHAVATSTLVNGWW